jgi:hypothetical protein
MPPYYTNVGWDLFIFDRRAIMGMKVRSMWIKKASFSGAAFTHIVKTPQNWGVPVGEFGLTAIASIFFFVFYFVRTAWVFALTNL